MTTTSPHNGINIAAIDEMRDAGLADPSTMKFSFAVNGTWQGGPQMKASTGSAFMAGMVDESRNGLFTMISDQPPPFGNNAGPNPMEYLLQAVAACYTIGFAQKAAQAGIELESLRIDVEADVDVATIFGVDPDGTPGASQIRASISVASPDTSQEELEDLFATVVQTSPIRDTLVRPIDVVTSLNLR